MSRREFTNRQKAEIVHRAMNADGQVVCEGCGLVLGKKPYHIDHTIPEALILDKAIVYLTHHRPERIFCPWPPRTR